MIISHEHNYIFIKAEKVAGTSLELALAQSCGEEDIIGHIDNLSTEYDEETYAQPEKNNNGLNEHTLPERIKKLVGPEIWDSYLKVVVVRNPWNMVVSRYHWMIKEPTRYSEFHFGHEFLEAAYKIYANGFSPEIIRKSLAKIYRTKKLKDSIRFQDFDSFVQYYPNKWTNDRYYFAGDGKPYFDKFLRFENIQDDFDSLCDQLGTPKMKLPGAKRKVRDDKRHYSEYYNDETREMVARKFSRQLETFGYQFEVLPKSL